VPGRLDGKVAIVTGAGSGGADAGVGIGQAISTVLAREGASVLLFDKEAARAEATLATLGEHPGRGAVFVGDVTKPEDCAAMVAAAIDTFGGLDILVNNAGISKHAPITDTTMELYESVIAVNLTGSFLACQHAIPALIDRGGGSIVNIGSVAAIRDSGTSHPAYCASKAAQLGLAIDLAGAYGRSNIRVNTVLPGMVATPMQQSISAGSLDDDVRSHLNLLGRMGNAWDIAHAVLFLCTDEAAYITGVTLPVDGGATAAMPATVFRGRSSASARQPS
jgi:NAD(P)-dependent dehydrogenase (short-subunit alcohol dehydrogenase family)